MAPEVASCHHASPASDIWSSSSLSASSPSSSFGHHHHCCHCCHHLPNQQVSWLSDIHVAHWGGGTFLEAWEACCNYTKKSKVSSLSMSHGIIFVNVKYHLVSKSSSSISMSPGIIIFLISNANVTWYHHHHHLQCQCHTVSILPLSLGGENSIGQ